MPQIAQEMSHSDLRSRVFALLAEVDKLTAKLEQQEEKKSPRFHMRPDETAGMSVEQVIEKCLNEKRVVTWKAACAAAGLGQYYPSKIPQITAAFASKKSGADALIVNKQGKYGKEGIVERHHSTLKLYGFTQFPTL